ncbi:aminotransferase class I/II-fold pyridoxal phosphate-dependent enzyme [Cohnella lubricantis]|uniref:Aminotransferase class I/II-fold pyridoxal phosphate-dependent enzyme n=1 Tax=Cohnella lubricantis TaxID=2163172 RepID=A0A841TDR4_9BACL|nr:aminotransferase class I/II-fold pyridoxal phosphate-dependent enzyme [Cohnella lubricantis]MBB6679172.1 aminotransferase class I/II-fold pyridoxal phosphate-dependent enzyme [Cohnella lubricantis]MBP2119324.1 arginine/lysine/ornithine decarboxylase [Cohnella lubricantis]
MTLDPMRAPLFEALENHAKRRTAPFHVPGHKQRAAWSVEAAKRRYAELLPIDLTELSGTDDLHHPEGVIAEAEKLTAHCFGAEESRLLVGGSTAGNLAMILGVCRSGDVLLVQRNVHKSIIHALMLADARAVFLPPAIDPQSGLATAPTLESVRSALQRYPEAKALVLSNPNYYGLSVRLERMIQASHEQGIPVLVDEAHGPHFGHHPALPGSALAAGADVVVQSAHKMLSAMTMGAWLHLQGRRVPREAIRQHLRMLQSSSPSYPIMASLDLARRELHTRQEQCFEAALATAQEVRSTLRGSPFGVVDVPNEDVGLEQDPLKLVLFDAAGVLDGFELQRELEQRGCVAEMADARYVVLALGAGTRPEDGEALLQALQEIAAVYRLEERVREAAAADDGIATVKPRYAADSQRGAGLSWHVTDRQGEPAGSIAMASVRGRVEETIPEPARLSRDVFNTEAVELEKAVGRRCGEWVIPYPPGIPVLYPGETVTAETVVRLALWRKEGARIQGAADASLKTLQVARQEDS